MLLAPPSPAAAGEQDLFKAWTTDQGGTVTFERCGQHICGYISGLSPDHEGPPPLDIHNPDPALSQRELLGLRIFWNFAATHDDKWSGGRIYNTDDGKTYDSNLSIRDDGKLKMKGCVLFFCQSRIWPPTQAMAGNDAPAE